MDQYTSEDARREWRRILNTVENGNPVGITRYGKPLAEVVPATATAALALYAEAMPVALAALKKADSDEARAALEEIGHIFNKEAD
jgi:prevent-host-death family protein